MKRCPLFLIASKDPADLPLVPNACLEDDCAWFLEFGGYRECAVYWIGQSTLQQATLERQKQDYFKKKGQAIYGRPYTGGTP